VIIDGAEFPMAISFFFDRHLNTVKTIPAGTCRFLFTAQRRAGKLKFEKEKKNSRPFVSSVGATSVASGNRWCSESGLTGPEINKKDFHSFLKENCWFRSYVTKFQ
jgi:hypothetical protein